MTNSTTTTAAPSVNTPSFFVTDHVLTMKYTGYKGWSGKCYGKGRVSGVTAINCQDIVKIGRITEKAVQIIQHNRTEPDGSHVFNSRVSAWVPKSKCKFNDDGSFTVGRGFCYFAGNFPKWTEAPSRTFSPYRRTVI